MPALSDIAIDGPVASGKTVVGRSLAHCLGYRFVDTGNMYRAVTWAALERDIDPQNEAHLSSLAAALSFEVVPGPEGEERLLIDGEDVTEWLREPSVERWVSAVSAVAEVRRALVSAQRRLAKQGEVVMVGRDIGTVVLPDAKLKVFLMASPEERAHRRYLELQGSGKPAEYGQVLRELQQRDETDSQRAASPLRPAEDARILDTSGLNVDEVVDRIISLMEIIG